MGKSTRLFDGTSAVMVGTRTGVEKQKTAGKQVTDSGGKGYDGFIREGVARGQRRIRSHTVIFKASLTRGKKLGGRF